MGGIAARRTRGCCYNALVIVPLGGNGLLSRKNLAANRAFFALGKTRFGTGSVSSGEDCGSMPLGGYDLLRGDDLIAYQKSCMEGR